MKEEQEENILKWRFDVNAFRLLGRELITDRITALVELVKNSYDANATKVWIDFENVLTKSSQSKIIIRDNGIGMSLDDVQNKWMVVGTKSKRVKDLSPAPFKRKYIGEKGIGRFAVDKLGGCLNMTTKTEDAKEQLEVTINWEDYAELAMNTNVLTLFTDVENTYYRNTNIGIEKGTILSVSNLHEIWTKRDIERAKEELSKIISPFHRVKGGFEIYINSNDFKEFSGKPIILSTADYKAEKFDLSFENGKQESLKFNKETGKIETEFIENPSFGLINMKIFYFNTDAKKEFNKKHKVSGRKIDGFKVYRDGVLATPFADRENDPMKQRDVFGVDRRLWQDTYDTIGNREIIGLIDISKEKNPLIRDATNRQDFIENEAYLDFKSFIFQQLEELKYYKISNRELKKKDVTEKFVNQKEELKSAISDFNKVAKQIKRNNPLLRPQIELIEAKLKDTGGVVGKLALVNKEFNKEVQRKENLYLSLMSLQEYAANLSHAVRTSLGKIKRLAEFFKKNFPDEKFDKQFKLYAPRIFDEIMTLEKVVDFMLSYAKAGLEIEEFNVKEVIENLFLNYYQHVFQLDGIHGLVEIKDDFILNGNKKFLEDIFENLVSNSVKALASIDDKMIKISGGIEGNKFVCYFSDNGEGIREKDKDKIFEIYHTTTASKGGAGLGLFIVKKRIEALNGDVELIEKEFEYGTTFRITLPFNKDYKNDI